MVVGMIVPLWLRPFVQHIAMSLWRKKPLLLAIVMVSTVLLLAFQYHSVTGPNSPKAAAADALVQSQPGDGSDGGDERLHRFAAAAVNDAPSQTVPRRNLSALSAHSLVEGRVPFRPPYNNDQSGDASLVGNPGRQRLIAAEINSNQVPAVENSRLLEPGSQQGQSLAKGGYIPGLRLVHFDLKGAPPKISYFKQIFPLLKEAGANAILLEYEDTFPFWGALSPIASSNAYSKDDLRAILELARIHSFEVIPLVQTFGHLEFALKLDTFRHLREVDQFPMAICPSKNDSFNLVTQIVDQVMALHHNAKWLHIGCDEVFHLGYCDKCRMRDRDVIYLDHVSRVARYVRDKHSTVPIIWDDMLRNIAPERLKESGLGQLVEPMVWTYVRDVYRFIPYSTWLSFAEVFPNIWAASAFKGAFGETLTVPNVKMHLENNEAWLEVMAEQQKNFKNFRGIVVTGWQRYDHLATLCETLPAGLPSLIIDLLTLTNGKFEPSLVWKKFDRIMNCPSSRMRYPSTTGSDNSVDLEQDPYLWERAAGCAFPGAAVFRLTQHVSDAVKRVNEYIYDVTVHKAWMTDYNVLHNMSNPFRVDEGLQEHGTVYYTLTSLMRTAEDALREVFDKYTSSEWIEQNIYPYVLKLEKLMKNGVELKKARVWPKRPLPPLEDLKRFSVGVDNN